ncbi:hypothetical protein DAPPUDRAFT_114449 [Daphnia pulex]|uniref:Uncharacterized protein n=1 Tax=Daphnia pulex TaxID=6669 RepID=E9HI64_DAPPU|nr:hypothetical protein DAPPUDRAFT_114449 [Daphnia pulex]|eukprot:EFX68566.1 hypothetical protein DAPPUDRAFT_114449 [Daphnia pulex]
MTDIVMAEELTTKKARVTTTTTTSSPKIQLSPVDEVEATPAPANKTRKTSNRPRTSGSRRKQSSKAKTVVDAVQEEDIPKAEMTSPASVDTASALAPKNFKPTPKPLEEFQQTQGLMEFLKKRKFERIQASTTEDPFVAILATATTPPTEESVSPASERSVFVFIELFSLEMDCDMFQKLFHA